MNTERLKGWLCSSTKLVAASAQLAKKQAELTALNNVTLPKLYHAIGKQLVGSSNLPPDLVRHREKIHELEAAISTKPEYSKPEPASSFAAKAKHLAQQAASKTAKATADAAALVKTHAAYVTLGKQAIDRYGPNSLPQDLREQYESATQKQVELADEIGGLKSVPGKEFVTPGRLAIFGVAACGLLGFWTLHAASNWLFSRPQNASVAATRPRQDASSGFASSSNQTANVDSGDDEYGRSKRSSREDAPQADGMQRGQPRGPSYKCPLGWAQLTQMTGAEGPSARYIRGPDRELQRVEALYDGSLVVAVTRVDGGFRVTIASDIAVADFTSRPWFTRSETDGLVEAYSQYVAKAPGSGDEKVIGRFRVQMEQDPQLPIRPSFVLRGAR